MSNLKVGDRVRHSVRKKKGKVLSIHPSCNRKELFIRVLTERGGKESISVWAVSKVKPIVTVRG